MTTARNRAEIDITGRTYHKLTAIRFSHRGDAIPSEPRGYSYWLFECQCGNEKVMIKSAVTSGNSRSCGACVIRPNKTKEQLIASRAEVVAQLQKVDRAELTDIQIKVLDLFAEGISQVEIAKRLGVNQSSVCKHLHGQWVTKHNKKFGGIMAKVKKLNRMEQQEKDKLKVIIDNLTAQRDQQRVETNKLSLYIRQLEQRRDAIGTQGNKEPIPNV